jgi:hypothetical protein
VSKTKVSSTKAALHHRTIAPSHHRTIAPSHHVGYYDDIEHQQVCKKMFCINMGVQYYQDSVATNFNVGNPRLSSLEDFSVGSFFFHNAFPDWWDNFSPKL